MRRSSYGCKWLFDDSQRLIGIDFGNDGCAEHGHTSKTFKTMFGVPEIFEEGLVDRQITKLPPNNFKTYKSKGKTAAQLLFAPHRTSTYENADLNFPSYSSKNMNVFWSDYSGFAIVVRGREDLKLLNELKKEFESGNIAFGNDYVFHGGEGQVFLIADRIPEIDLNKVLQSDREAASLRMAVEMSGIVQELKDAGRGYYALSPGWANKDKTELQFFLNPRDQKNVRAGRYSLEDLQKWAEGYGPVFKVQPEPTPSASPVIPPKP